jgi:uncharacterized protein involved in propanediol utilization
VRYLPKPHTARGGTHPAGTATGTGHAPAHHGELLQGVFADRTGCLRRALVTIPVPHHGSRAVFHPSQHHWGILGTPELTKVRRAAILTLQELATHPTPTKGGQIEITSDIPRGIGMGSSTSDVTATIRAVADYHGVSLPRETIGRIAVHAECASDSIMIDDRVVLFAHRDGEILETLGHQLPPLVIVGCNTQPGIQVNTLQFRPARYHEDEIASFQVLRAALRRAIATDDLPLLGRVATASARINQRFLPKPPLDALLDLCRRLGGHGIQIAHSGTVAGLIFDPGPRTLTHAVPQARAAFAELGLTSTTIVNTDQPTATATRNLSS